MLETVLILVAVLVGMIVCFAVGAVVGSWLYFRGFTSKPPVQVGVGKSSAVDDGGEVNQDPYWDYKL